MKIIHCSYLGLMGPDIALWNLHEDIPNHPEGSTVSTATLAEAGYLPPKEELDRAAREIIANPKASKLMKGVMKHLQSHFLHHPASTECDLHYNPEPHFPVEISTPAGMSGTTHLHLQIWIREWFSRVYGYHPEDDFVEWCCDIMERGGAILMKHEPKPE